MRPLSERNSLGNLNRDALLFSCKYPVPWKKPKKLAGLNRVCLRAAKKVEWSQVVETGGEDQTGDVWNKSTVDKPRKRCSNLCFTQQEETFRSVH